MSAGLETVSAGPPTPKSASSLGDFARASLRRIGIALIVLWGALTVGFLALKTMPGDPVATVVGGSVQVTPELRAQITEQYGLDQPLIVQYFNYFGNLLRGDLGDSYVLRKPVTEAIFEQLPNTVTLVISATVVSLVFATIIALVTAKRGPAIRSTFQGIESVAIAVPSFWLGLMLITVFSFGFKLLPATGSQGPLSLIMPTLALAIPIGATISQIMRDSIEKTLGQPFITTVRARGAGERRVRLGHALRHSLISVVTLVGWLAGTMIGGSVIVEQVFSRAGIGRMAIFAVTSQDMPVVLGVIALSALFYIVINAVIDILYPIIDPRLRP